MFLPGEHRPHYAVWHRGRAITRWLADKRRAADLAREIPGSRLVVEWRAWEIAPGDWLSTEDAAMSEAMALRGL